jgi:hypothetical protein
MNSQPVTGYAPVNGVGMYWESRGSDTVPPLVLVHGEYSTPATHPSLFGPGPRPVACPVIATGRIPGAAP